MKLLTTTEAVASKNFGDGWMSRNAAELCRIMFVFGNVDPMDLVRALPRGDREKINVRSVERALATLRAM